MKDYSIPYNLEELTNVTRLDNTDSLKAAAKKLVRSFESRRIEG